jgi:gamma-glutamylcyclotransferase (GGCT)/AIG2-like uncharacterized protein YtfP
VSDVLQFPIRGQKERNQKVFIYGTLKKGFYFHDQYLGFGRSDFLGEARAGSDLTLLVDVLPSLIRRANSDELVKGELYSVDEDVLKSLDELEGHPSVYRREVIDVVMPDGKTETAWAYIRPAHFKGHAMASKEAEFV